MEKLKCNFSFSDENQVQSAPVWTVLHNSSAKRDGSERMCANWRTGTAGLNWQERQKQRSSRLDWHHWESKLQPRRVMKTSCALRESGPKSAAEQGQNRVTSGPLRSAWMMEGPYLPHPPTLGARWSRSAVSSLQRLPLSGVGGSTHCFKQAAVMSP